MSRETVILDVLLPFNTQTVNNTMIRELWGVELQKDDVLRIRNRRLVVLRPVEVSNT
jgi:hypothetical protein